MNEFKNEIARNKIKEILYENQFELMNDNLLAKAKHRIQDEMFLLFNQEISCNTSFNYENHGINGVVILPGIMENVSLSFTVLNQAPKKKQRIYIDLGDD